MSALSRNAPCMAIVDKQGIIRFKYFGGFRKEPVTQFIRALVIENNSPSAKEDL